MSSNYSSLCRAQLTFEYLHTNSTTHEFLFGALAELVDNSRDAGATKMNIYTVADERYRGSFLLNFLDDGCGMDPVELSQVIQFGRSMKRNSGSNQIGQYGNGLKSGSMRIGKDMILLTKKGSTMSCLFLSRSFHEQEGIHEVIVPMPSWDSNTKEPLVKDKADAQRYEVEMEIILKHSPFKTREQLMEQFEAIEGTTGTLVVIFNLKLLDSGESELDFTTNDEDILMRDPHADEEYGFDEHTAKEKVSFRAYVSILYCEPRMRIYIQGRKVRTKRLIYSLYKAISYSYTSNRFRTRSEKEVEKAEHEAKIAEEKAKEMALQAKEAMPRDVISAKNSRQETQSRQMKAEKAKIDAEVKRRIANEKKKSLKDPKELVFTFGFNISDRKYDGMYIYNCNRLIRMSEKVGPQLEGGVKCSGVVGIVDVPYLVLEPTHNKQDFADAKEYKHLLRSMAEHMMQYWKDSKVEDHGITVFWEEFGYTGRWQDSPSQDQKYVLKRAMSVPLCVQCDLCLKWRQLQFSRKLNFENISDTWTCSMNTDNNFKSCVKPEQKMAIPRRVLQKEIKSVEQRAEQDIKRLTEKLKKAEKIANKNKPATPSPPPPQPSTLSRKPSLNPTFASKPTVVASAAKPKAASKPSPVQETRKASKGKPQVSDDTIEMSLNELSSIPRSTRAIQKKVESKAKPPPTPPKKTTPSPAKNVVPPARTSKVAGKAGDTRTGIAKKRPSLKASEEEDDEDDMPLITKRKKTTQEESKVLEDSKSISNGPQSKTKYQMNSRVEARINARWYSGKVTSLKSSTDTTRVKVKFDLHKQDKFDKWFDDSDANLRLLSEEAEAPSANSAHVEVTSPMSTNEISSSIASPSSTNDVHSQDSETLHVTQELLDGVCKMFRRCLHYFRPPDFPVEKNDILHNLTPAQLKDFDLVCIYGILLL